MAREQKKHHKQEHQQKRSSAAEKLKFLEEENRLLKQKLNQNKKKQQPKPQAGSAPSPKKNLQQRTEKTKQVRDTPEPKPKRLKVLQFSKDAPAHRVQPAQRKADTAAEDKIKDQERLEALQRGIEEDERLIQELQGKLGSGWKKELEEEVSLDAAHNIGGKSCAESLTMRGFPGAGGLLRLAGTSRPGFRHGGLWGGRG